MTEAMYTTDCRSGHHGDRCGMTPCRCECHRSQEAARAAALASPAPAPRAEEES